MQRKTCVVCQCEFERAPHRSNVQWAKQRTCSMACKHRALGRNADERFFAKVVRSEGCWSWVGFTHRGYGKFTFQRRVMPAHRYSYESLHGLVPEGFELDHLCRNKGCVNPAHLEVVTHAENVRRHYRLRSKAAA